MTDDPNVGTLAYLDSFGGLVPCKVLHLNGTMFTVKVTANRPGYTRGEVLVWDRKWVVRRPARRRNGNLFVASI